MHTENKYFSSKYNTINAKAEFHKKSPHNHNDLRAFEVHRSMQISNILMEDLAKIYQLKDLLENPTESSNYGKTRKTPHTA